MKNYIIALVTVFLFTLNSCDEETYLDIEQKGVVPVESTYEKADDNTVMSFIAGIYTSVCGNALDGFASFSNSTGVISMRNYFFRMGGESSQYWLYTETAESAKPHRVFWGYAYSIIYSCNLLLEYLPNNTIASASVVDRAIAEARAIRAIMMMQLVQLYGNPPLADHIMNGTEGNTPASESWAFIENELSTVAEELPSKSGPDGQADIGGRLTKEAVYAYLGKAYLWQKKYSEAAITLHDKVIATNLYILVNNYNDLNNISSDFCPENIWEYELSEDPNYFTSQAGAVSIGFVNWDVVKLYIPDGYYTLQGYSEYSCTSESFGSFMDKHDRLADSSESNRYFGTLLPYEDLFDTTRFSYTNTGGNMGLREAMTWSEGYFRIKGIPPIENIGVLGGVWYQDIIVKNWVFMRYSEVLLNYAEAVAEGGTPGAMSGLNALNLVRNRAGLTDAPSLNMDNEEYGVKAERRAELFYEGCRFIDLVRWGDAPTVLKDVGKKLYQFFGYENNTIPGPQSKAEWQIVVSDNIGIGFQEGRDELFAIPNVERNNNPNLTQNPGW